MIPEPFPEALFQVFAANQLHHEIQTFALFKVVRHLRENFVIQIRQPLRFMPEGQPTFFSRGECLFDGNSGFDAPIYSFIDCAHSAMSQSANDAIAILENVVRSKHTDSEEANEDQNAMCKLRGNLS
jgi:hypothetical protein